LIGFDYNYRTESTINPTVSKQVNYPTA